MNLVPGRSARSHWRALFFRVFAGEDDLAYDTKTIAELEKIATNLRGQIALHPDYQLERVELKECEKWIELRRRETPISSAHTPRAA